MTSTTTNTTTSTTEKLAVDLGKILLQRGFKITTAESCTGGGLAYTITSVPGSSRWFEYGFITYSDAAKIALLGVNSASLDCYGAVSAVVAAEMAQGALQKSGADMSVAITGIAGPDGGSKEKPVGTVWLSWASQHFNTVTKVIHCQGDRQAVREQSIEHALRKLLARVL